MLTDLGEMEVGYILFNLERKARVSNFPPFDNSVFLPIYFLFNSTGQYNLVVSYIAQGDGGQVQWPTQHGSPEGETGVCGLGLQSVDIAQSL